MKRDRGNDVQHRQAIARLRRGDLIVVRFGAKGGQLAEVLGMPTSAGRLPVRKWRRRSTSWTLRTFVRAGEVLHVPRATQRDTLRRWGATLGTMGGAPARREIEAAATERARDELRSIFGRLA